MEFQRSISLPSSTTGGMPFVPTAVRLLVSEPFAAAFAAAIPVDLISVDVRQPRDDEWHQVMRCAFTTTAVDVPSVARKFLPDVLHLSWEQTWTLHDAEAATATLRVVTDSSPSAKTTGEARLTGTADELGYTFTGRTKVSVPFIGGTLADLIDDNLIGGLLNDQLDVLTSHMAAPPA